jgi:hypothetical protein
LPRILIGRQSIFDILLKILGQFVAGSDVFRRADERFRDIAASVVGDADNSTRRYLTRSFKQYLY